MLNIIELVILIVLFGCTQSEHTKYSNEQTLNYSQGCDQSVPFGDINICLPIIDGMTECYAIPQAKAKADEGNFEGNSILAYYLNNNTFKQLARIDEMSYDDYFQIYVTNKFKGLKVGQSELDQMGSMFADNFLKENWTELKRKFEKNYDNLSASRPVLIENYSPNSKIRTFVLLNKLQTENEEAIFLSTINILLIKERFIFLAYFKDYNGEESINSAKSKNDYIVLHLLEENK